MTSINHDFAETDPATEALILQLIAQDFGQEVPQTLLGTNSGSDHQEGNPHWDNQGSNSQWDIQDSNNQCDNSGSDIGEDQILEPSDSQTALPVGQEDSHSRYVSVDHNNTGARGASQLHKPPALSLCLPIANLLTSPITAALTQAKESFPIFRITISKR